MSTAGATPSSMRPLRVCHVIHSLQPGGAEDSIAAIAGATGAARVEVEVLSLLPLGESRVARRLIENRIPVMSLELGSRWDARALPAAARLLDERVPDVIHTHLKHADVVGSYASRKTGIPMVSTLHVVEDGVRGIARAKRSLGAWARRRGARMTIAVSDAQRSWYVHGPGAGCPQDVVTVRNGVADPPPLDEAGRRRLRDELGVPDGELMASMVGIMRPGKGHDDVLALAEAVGRNAGIRFVLAGDGPLRAELEARAAVRAAASAPVVFAGFREDAPALLAASDLVLHPSHADALPTALIHALAAGRPTLAYRVGGIPEIVTPEAGILVEPFDTAALLAGLDRLLRSAELRAELGAGARRRYEEEFTLDAWMSRLREVYVRALEVSTA